MGNESLSRELIEQDDRQSEKYKYDDTLPILKYSAEIKKRLLNNDTLILIGETGSGKTTELPGMILDVLPPNSKIIITEPRRVAATSTARYVAKKLNSKLGDEVGYQVRFDSTTSLKTKMTFMTEGVLLHRLKSSPLLEGIDAVMVDEVHERGVNVDLLLALLKNIQETRKEQGLKPLKLVVASATMEKEKLREYFSYDEPLEIPGRLYPIKIHYESETPVNYQLAAAKKVKEIIDAGLGGDILIFMPGEAEIKATIGLIETELADKESDCEILPLYGSMSMEDQDRIFARTSRRKVIVATNIAETSVTIDGVRHVIDSGYIKQIDYNPETGIESLGIRRHAKSGLKQRAGRAGRTSPGDVYRLFSESDFAERYEFQTPEIQRCNLEHVVLLAKKIGINNLNDYDLLDPPSSESVARAERSLRILGALDEAGDITHLGEHIAEFPLEPRMARMIIEAEKLGCSYELSIMAAMLSVGNLMVRPHDKEYQADQAHARYKNLGSDVMAALMIWKDFEESGFNRKWAHQHFLRAQALKEAGEIRRQLLGIMRSKRIHLKSNPDPDIIHKAVLAGHIEDVFIRDYRYSYLDALDNSKVAQIFPGSAVFRQSPDLVCAIDVRITNAARGITYMTKCFPIKKDWIVEVASGAILSLRDIGDEPYFDENTGLVVVRKRLVFGKTDLGTVVVKEK